MVIHKQARTSPYFFLFSYVNSWKHWATLASRLLSIFYSWLSMTGTQAISFWFFPKLSLLGSVFPQLTVGLFSLAQWSHRRKGRWVYVYTHQETQTDNPALHTSGLCNDWLTKALMKSFDGKLGFFFYLSSPIRQWNKAILNMFPIIWRSY